MVFSDHCDFWNRFMKKKQPLPQHLCVLISVFDNAILEHVVLRRCIYTTKQLKGKCVEIILYQWFYTFEVQAHSFPLLSPAHTHKCSRRRLYIYKNIIMFE